MSWSALLLAAAAAATLLVLVVKLRGGDGRGDLIAPRKRKPRRLARVELGRLTDLVGRGESAEALRRLEGAGYDEATAKRLVRLMTKLEAADGDEGGDGA